SLSSASVASSLSRMDYHKSIANRLMVPALLSSLNDENRLMAADAARALKIFLESYAIKSDPEYLRKEYGTMMGHLKEAITAATKTFTKSRLIDLLTCAGILAKAVGREAFEYDAREILPVMCEAYPTLFLKELISFHLLPLEQRDREAKRVERLLDVDSMMRNTRMLTFLSSMIGYADGNDEVQQKLKNELRDLSILLLSKWKYLPNLELALDVSQVACRVVCQWASSSVYSGVEVQTAHLLLKIVRRPNANVEGAVQAVIYLLRSLKDNGGTELKIIWGALWTDLKVLARRHFSVCTEGAEKLLISTFAIKKCIPILGSEVLLPDVKEMVELMKDNLAWVIELWQFKKKKIPLNASLTSSQDGDPTDIEDADLVM
ncbi:hypothetical protein PMAYCL1PPCAC_28423, partial [Pristionchus mayeri]